jgi:penicillin-binding protein 1A
MGARFKVKKFLAKLKKKSKSQKLSVYSNLGKSRKAKKETKRLKDAHYFASLPKNRFKRLVYFLKPKNFAHYWFSKRGLVMFGKIAGIGALLLCLFIGGLFVYFRQDLNAISPGEINKRVQSTVNTYLDRNGQVLWEDKGSGDYKLVVESNQISQYLKDATVSIEDKDFYKHAGVSLTGLARALFNNIGGGSTQGGSTLTQQLVKQVYFADEAQQRGLNGIPRKIKELVLSIEVERMYNKDQILTLYLNESPYGGRRNGVESGAQTYFGKSAKDLTVAEAALLAAIPQNPSVYNPYNVAGHEALIGRQHSVIDSMEELGYITKDQADEAKKYPIIDNLLPESNQFKDIKAPHFVQMVKSQLEDELGKTVVGKGGLTITTTLDLRIQTKLEEAMDDMFNSYVPAWAGFEDGAATVEDTKTGQIVALLGSRDYNYPGFGQDNAAIASIQPGSTVKPLVYSELFQQKPVGQQNYGSGSILKDENIDSIYGARVNNADQQFKGDITIRFSLATSRNIPAIKAMYISGVKTTLNTIHSLGGTSYCTQGDEVNVGLAAAIGGCGIQQVDLVNAYASLARQGVYKPQSSVLEVKDNVSNQILKKWADVAGDQIVDPQSAYIVSDMLTDPIARIPLDGYHPVGMEIPGVQTASKTGTSDKGGQSKDIWMMSYSPALTMGVWLGNPDASLLKVGTSILPGSIIAKVMEYAHKDVYAPAGLWKSGDWYTQPSGIQRFGTEIYPSWWSRTQSQTTVKIIFDKVSKKKATSLTPSDAKVELDVTKTIDPITKKDVFTAPDGYDANSDDNIHQASDIKPSGTITVKPSSTTNNAYDITVTLLPGTFAINSASLRVDGTEVKSLTSSGIYTYTVPSTKTGASTASISIMDAGYYTNEGDITATIPAYISDTGTQTTTTPTAP